MVKIAILGCGLMGLKIAGELAYHGHRVKLYDSNVDALNSAHLRLEEDKKWLRNEGLLPQRNFVGQILCMSRLEETVNDAEFVLEAVVDDLLIKTDLFERISHCTSPNAIIATNALQLDVNDIADRTLNKTRCLGLRFLFPVYYIPEVEITPGKETSPETIEKVRSLLERMGKTLFFRSGGDPLILTEEQREERKKIRQQQIHGSSGLAHVFEGTIPTLSHQGNISPSTQEEVTSPSDGDRDCAICMDRHRDCLLCPCHHMVTCSECAKLLVNRKDSCPICRKDIVEIIRVFHS